MSPLRAVLLTLLATTTASAQPPDGPLAPDQERASFRLADPDLVVELVASEPQVVSPVAIAWDEAGALYVAEMTDYPLGPPSGRIRRLDDRDPATGRYRRDTVFARDIPFPTGVLPHDGGLLVTAAPDILFLKDTDADGVSDTRTVVLTGFAEGNQQLRVNALQYGLDNRIYGANGRSSGTLRRPADPPGQAVSIDLSDFRIDPATFAVEPASGFSQFGLAHDDWGDRFPSWNTVPLRHVVLERPLLLHNPRLAAPIGVADILPPGDVALFPISPPPRTFNRESVRAFNASCGTTIYRGEALGPAYAGNAFIAEPLTHLVHRRVLEPKGATFRAARAEQGREFLASTDPWFHPVNFATGPDGALYVVDFYREWVEHPDFVPVDMRPQVDWRRGADHGRIWRISRASQPLAAPPRLDRASGDELVQALAHPNAWVRTTAQRLLVTGGRPDADPALRALAAGGPSPLARLHAFWTLEGREALDEETLRRALRDNHARVREHALRLFSEHPDRAADGKSEILRLALDPEARVRFRSALLLAPRPEPEARAALAGILERDAADPWVARGVLCALDGHVLPLVESLVVNGRAAWLESTEADRVALLLELGTLVGAGGTAADRAALARLAAGADPAASPAPGRLALVVGLGEGLARAGQPLADPDAASTTLAASLRPAFDAAERVVPDRSLVPLARSLALRLLVQGRPPAAARLLPGLLAADLDPDLQRTAVAALAALDDVATAERLLQGYSLLPATTRPALVAALAGSSRLATALADALEAGTLRNVDVSPDLRPQLAHLPDPALRERFNRLLAPVASDRPQVVRRYRDALDRPGSAADPKQGEALFLQHCATCHQTGGRGQAVGPDLTGVASRPAPALVDDILDPSREVSPDFRNFVATDRDGRVATGLLVAETAAGVTLRGPGAVETFIPRGDLEALELTDKSLMPEGLESQLDPAQLAQLIAFLRSLATP